MEPHPAAQMQKAAADTAPWKPETNASTHARPLAACLCTVCAMITQSSNEGAALWAASDLYTFAWVTQQVFQQSTTATASRFMRNLTDH